MRDNAIAVDLYNLAVGGGGDDVAEQELGRRARAVRDRSHGICFDANMGFPLIAECSHTLYSGTCPGHKNGVMVKL